MKNKSKTSAISKCVSTIMALSVIFCLLVSQAMASEPIAATPETASVGSENKIDSMGNTDAYLTIDSTASYGRINATIPLWVNMVADNSTGIVAAPNNYGIYNYGLADLKVTEINVEVDEESGWLLCGGNPTAEKSISVMLNGTVLFNGNVILQNPWIVYGRAAEESPAVEGEEPTDNYGFLPLPISAKIASSGKNPVSKGIAIFDVTYVIKLASD